MSLHNEDYVMKKGSAMKTCCQNCGKIERLLTICQKSTANGIIFGLTKGF